MADSYVCTTAMMTCSFGVTPVPLVVNPSRNVFLQGKQRANIGDFAPMTNIASFGMCSAPTNPTVISATAAAMGVFTPMPCVPAIVSPWIPGKPDLLIQGMPALTKSCTNMCMWLGQITFTTDGQTPAPPPMTTPPPGKMNCVPSGMTSPLSDKELASLSEDDREQYNEDIAEASKVGAKNEMLSGAWEKTADNYVKEGQADKADMARQMAEQERNTAADKKNTAMGEVNKKYRETLPPSDEDMAKLSEIQQMEYKQRRADILAEKSKAYKEASIDRQLYDNVANDMKAPGNYSNSQEMASNKGTGLLVGIIGAAVEHFAKKAADEKAYDSLKQLNQETHQQIQLNSC